ncbi:PH domain-containing protein [Methylohalobius crimeensis]|uniref:PH domain-containing protein n=1 Tax=Methylohalobius crimeensis TaxID=244365 RepID=UPI0003B31F70|nr:PH domain-containing protein [Methylohalobius crimeensis]
MSEIDVILDHGQRPFERFERAAWLRDVLAERTGESWRIQKVEGGFAVAGSGKAVPEGTNAPETTSFDPVMIRQALRVSLPFYLPFLLLGALLGLAPVLAVRTVLEAMHLPGLPAWLDPALVIGFLRLAGWGVAALSALALYLPWVAHRYAVTPEGVEQSIGIIARETHRVRFEDIRSIGLKQGLIARLFNIGTLEFSAAGTDGVDVRFINIVSPMKIREWIERLSGGS